MSEEWRPVVGHPHYEVSDLGRVRSVDRVITATRRGREVLQPRKGKVLKCCPDDKGYPMVSLGTKTRRVHILVLEAFRRPRPGCLQALHNDGDSTNPRLENLRWGSAASNTADAIAHGTHFQPRGEEHGGAKLTEANVRLIRCALGHGNSCAKLAAVFAVSVMTISRIHTNQNWKQECA